MKKWLLVFFILPHFAYAFDRDQVFSGPSDWNEFRKFVVAQEEENERIGLSYLISGVVAGVGGAVAYQQADDIFSRSAFLIASNLGLAAFGWGANYYFTSSELSSFFKAVDGSSLSPQQKNEVLQRYLYIEREEQKKRRWIKVATHLLLAGVNFYSAGHESNPDLRTVFYVLGGANTVIALSYSF